MSPQVHTEGGPAWSQLFGAEKYSQSLERGLAILRCFTPEHPVLGIADIADELGMSPSTIHRYVATLAALGYVEQGANRKYRLGLAVTDLGVSVLNATGLREHAHLYLEELRQRVGYPISMATLDGLEIVIIDYLRGYRHGREQANLSLQPGSRLPAYCRAIGKVLLAHLPEEELRERLAALTLTKLRSSTVRSKKKLGVELREAVEAGVAVSEEESAPGLISVAAPIRDASHEVVAAIDISAPAGRISIGGFVVTLSPHLLSTADRISARLGYRRSDEG